MAGLRHVEHVMGMAVSIDVRDDIDPDAVAEVVRWLHHVDETYSTYLADSAISRLGRGEVAIDDLDDEIVSVLERCARVKADTGGAFDIHAVPTPVGTTLDPSGLVKGWAVERAAAILTGAGAANVCVNAGGDIAVRGEASAGEPWRVGIRHPERADRLATVVHARGPTGIATSATYERGAHIIDPRTGAPTTDLASVTIVGPDLADADAFATAVFVMGLDGLVWLDEHRAATGYEGFVITHHDRTYATAGFARYR